MVPDNLDVGINLPSPEIFICPDGDIPGVLTLIGSPSVSAEIGARAIVPRTGIASRIALFFFARDHFRADNLISAQESYKVRWRSETKRSANAGAIEITNISILSRIL